MKFDINNYKGKYAMHCKTKEEAKDFCSNLHSLGKSWDNERSYKECTNYGWYKESTAYSFNEGCFCYVDYYKRNDYTILEWEDFMIKGFTKADLKTGDVILRRDGNTEIVNRELDMFITKNGWNDLNSIRDDLTSCFDISDDIVAVRRPYTKSDCVFNAFDKLWGTLVYERKEGEEMTLEEVCKALGKEIKIVKG